MLEWLLPAKKSSPLAEIHTRDTDIIYVLDGSVTFVTGGTVVEPRVVARDEIRGTRIEGGTARALNKGDVIVVMPGHAETVSGAAGINCDVAGVSIVGLGRGAARPTITMSAATTRLNRPGQSSRSLRR
mgnify:CR=1 FL=1